MNKVRNMNEEGRWKVVLARNSRFDGSFVYGVRSTGIYCRPSCPSRKPGRKQVIFFPVAEAAERAGFRPCRRCRPRDENFRNIQADKVLQVCRHMDAHPEELPTLAVLAAKVGSSPYYLQRIFKRLTGITPRNYFEAGRLKRLKVQLRASGNVLDAMYEAGYGSTSRLYESGVSQLGMTPRAYRNGGTGARIAYAIVASPLGRLLVAVTERGVCSVSLGGSDGTLESALRKEYPAAEIRRDREELKPYIEVLLEHMDGRNPRVDLPIDVQATAFQWHVWKLLLSIPYGSTRSYREIASALGRPQAARAVAQACRSNRVALLIPCHRVVRTGGELGGYRWGVERKRLLLRREKLLAGSKSRRCLSARPSTDN